MKRVWDWAGRLWDCLWCGVVQIVLLPAEAGRRALKQIVFLFAREGTIASARPRLDRSGERRWGPARRDQMTVRRELGWGAEG